ncbi:hypothetical protein [Acidovorax sp. SUPP2539]|uniref:portal protein n=1 Tax=Acidovorax sp. SUPP2539 TaxID=2920878 RepID=UPI0023DE494F|nr:hypothetical protein [Acidovorax sp. SUPP2539]GKS91213.1 portal protein [Acidovorax sp. SUPP2539]
MTIYTTPSDQPAGQKGADTGLSLTTFTRFMLEIQNQPAWRSRADREMDYVDGNQLDAEVLQRQKSLGMPPAIEPLVGPAIEAVLGLEAKTRTDWRITPDRAGQGDDVAAALNYRLNQAERNSKADAACTGAFRPQVCVGIGWVEVARETDPFKYPYRCRAVHRNEIYWDHLSVEPDMSDARYLLRRRWTDAEQAILKFPQHAELLRQTMGRWTDLTAQNLDGGSSTGLAMNLLDERGWSIEEQQWRDCETGRVCLFEMWYRKWEQVTVLKAKDGRVVEYNRRNPAHDVLLATGAVRAFKATMPRMYVSFWAGPHKLHDGKTPYSHHDFPYVPFWGHREDRTNIPFGRVRGMVYLQDNVNSAISKIRWGLSATRTERTKGATKMSDAQLRQQVSRVDADIILDQEHMAKQGAMFKVTRDFQLNEQQYKMLQDSRLGIERASGITSGFMGQVGNATSGVQEQTQVEQSTQTLAALMDNFKLARTKVGELLLALIIEDMQEEESILIPGNAIREDRTVVLNSPARDEFTGLAYRTNDVQRTRLKVALDDVPSSGSFRVQQLSALSEAFKAMPQNMQIVALPHMLALMDLPDKEEIIKAVREAGQQVTPEQIQERVDQAVQAALAQANKDEKALELDIKARKAEAEIGVLNAKRVLTGVQAEFSAMQGGTQVAQMPQIAPIADELMKAAGYQAPEHGGDDPNFPVPEAVPADPAGLSALAPAPSVRENTSPGFPPVPSDGASPLEGIETATPADNLQPIDSAAPQ